MLNKKIIQKVTFALGLMMALGGWGSSASADEGNYNRINEASNEQVSVITNDINGKSVITTQDEVTPFYKGDAKEDYVEGKVDGVDCWLVDSYGTSHSIDYIGNELSEGDRYDLDFYFEIKNGGVPKDKFVGFELYYDVNGSLQFVGAAGMDMTDEYQNWGYTLRLNREGIEEQQYFYFLIGIAPDSYSEYYSDGYFMRVTNPYYKNVSDGWLNTGYNKRYYKDGKPYVNQWLNENGAWYYFNAEGNAVVNDVERIDENLYIFDKNGVMSCKKGWNLIEKYDFSSDKVQHLWYWNNGDGTVKTKSWHRVNSTWYYLDMDGVMKTGWLKLGNTYYYLRSNGEMTTGWQVVDGKWYYMDIYGAMQTGWERVNNRWYYLKGSGEMATGWQLVGDKWYYMNIYGEMQTGWVRVNNSWYYLNIYGEMQTGWAYINNNWYYMYPSGVMATNTVIGGWKIDAYGIARQ